VPLKLIRNQDEPRRARNATPFLAIDWRPGQRQHLFGGAIGVNALPKIVVLGGPIDGVGVPFDQELGLDKAAVGQGCKVKDAPVGWFPWLSLLRLRRGSPGRATLWMA